MSEYRTQSRDTSRDVEAVLIARYKAMAPWEKVAMVRELSRASQQLALAGLRMRHPEADESELRMRLAATRLPPSVMQDAFGWAPPD